MMRSPPPARRTARPVRAAAVAFLAFGLVGAVRAQEDNPTTSQPAEAPRPSSAPVVAETPEVRDLAEILEPIRAEADVPALGGAFLSSKGLLALGATGVRALRDEGTAVPVTRDDLWHLG